MFYQSVIASVLFYAVVCWGGSIKKRDAGRLNRLIRKAGFVVSIELESLTTTAEKRTMSRMLAIRGAATHFLRGMQQQIGAPP
ncbi:hypothetical protein AALO_G00157260, partial [Alosa alosa]